MRKEVVDIDILITSKNGDGKIMQPTRRVSRAPTMMKNEN